MEMNNVLTEGKLSLKSVRDFLIKHNGKVKQTELVDQYRSELCNFTTKYRARQHFRDILQLITSAETKNGERYIILTKKDISNIQTTRVCRKKKKCTYTRKNIGKAKKSFNSEKENQLRHKGIISNSPLVTEKTFFSSHTKLFERKTNSDPSEKNPETSTFDRRLLGYMTTNESSPSLCAKDVKEVPAEPIMFRRSLFGSIRNEDKSSNTNNQTTIETSHIETNKSVVPEKEIENSIVESSLDVNNNIANKPLLIIDNPSFAEDKKYESKSTKLNEKEETPIIEENQNQKIHDSQLFKISKGANIFDRNHIFDKIPSKKTFFDGPLKESVIGGNDYFFDNDYNNLRAKLKLLINQLAIDNSVIESDLLDDDLISKKNKNANSLREEENTYSYRQNNDMQNEMDNVETDTVSIEITISEADLKESTILDDDIYIKNNDNIDDKSSFDLKCSSPSIQNDETLADRSVAIKNYGKVKTTKQKTVQLTRTLEDLKQYMLVKNECLFGSFLFHNNEKENDDYDGETINESSEEKKWMIASLHGDIKTLEKLVEQSPELIKNRDFIHGFSALHWAAKLGRADIAKLMIQYGTEIDMRSHGGYTPLHVAASSGKDEVIITLVQNKANIHCRDHSGLKPKDIVKNTVSANVQTMLGRSLIIDKNTCIKRLRH